MKYFSTTIFAALCTLILFGCTINPFSVKTDDREDDFEITAESVGTLVFQSIDEMQSTVDNLSVQNPASANLMSLSSFPLVSLDAQAVLGKKSASGGFNIDTIDGRIKITVTTSTLLYSKYDTIEVLMDGTVFDGVEGNESIIDFRGAKNYKNGTLEYYKIKDSDGDGIINGTLPHQKALLTIQTVYTKSVLGHPAGESVKTLIEVGAGKDNKFGSETDTAAQADNLIFEASWIKIQNSDTVAYVLFEDADGDGVVAAGCIGTIDVRILQRHNPLKPLVEYEKASLRIERDSSGKERTVRIGIEEKLLTGRLNRIWAVDQTGDSTIDPGDTAFIHFATNSPAVDDSEITAHAILKVDPGENLTDSSDNLLIEIQLEKSFRSGRLDSLQFHCVFDPPLSHGESPRGGSFEFKAMFRNGKTATLDGSFEVGVIKATFTGPEGNVVEVTLREGENQL